MSAPPNIVLITTDQQRYDTIGPHKPAFLQTPHLDALCRDGIRFDRAYADCPLCVPSRVTIMTGQPGHVHGMNYNGKTGDAMGRVETLPGRLRQTGYQTAAIGKMHFTPQRRRHGFEEMILPDDYYRQMRKAGHDFRPMAHGMGQNELHPARSTVPAEMSLTSWIADQSMEYIEHRRDPDMPMFLWCSFSKPHPPLDPPEPYFSMYANEDIPSPVKSAWSEPERCPKSFRFQQTGIGYQEMPDEQIRAARVAYYGLITQIDHAIGRVIAGLNQAGIIDNTLIIFASDHGEYLGDHRAGAKKFFHEVSARVPMIVRQPREVSDRLQGETCDDLVTLADILPTCVDANDVQGRSLIDAAKGNQPRKYVVFTAGHNLAYGITDGRYKYLYYPQGGDEQLFDLKEDPQETNVIANADVSARLRKLLESEVGELPKEDFVERTPNHLRVMGIYNDEYPEDIRH